MFETTMKKVRDAYEEARANDSKYRKIDRAPVDMTGAGLDLCFDENGYFDENAFQWGAQ